MYMLNIKIRNIVYKSVNILCLYYMNLSTFYNGATIPSFQTKIYPENL